MVKTYKRFYEAVNAHRLRSIASISGLIQRRLTLVKTYNRVLRSCKCTPVAVYCLYFGADSEEIDTMVKPTTGFEEVVNAYRLRSIAFISGVIDTMVKTYNRV
jgi:hypothetical protein